MNSTDDRPLLAEARKAGDDFLAGMLADGRLSVEAASGLATTGFTVTTRILADLRARDGLSEQAIVDAFERRLDQARRAGDTQRVISAGYTLAVWDGMQRDLAAYLRDVG